MSLASCQLVHSRMKMEVTEEFESSRTAYETVGQPMGATDEWWRGQDFHLHHDHVKIT